MKEVKMGKGRKGVSFLEEGKEWRLPGLLYADDMVLCGESEEDLRVMVGQFSEVCRRRGLKVNAGKSKMMLLNGKEGLECEIHIDGIHLEHVLEFKYLGCILDKYITDEAECSRKVASWRRVAGTITSLVNARDLQLEYARVSCMKHFLCLFLCMAARQYYGKRRRDLELGLYRCTTSEDC